MAYLIDKIYEQPTLRHSTKRRLENDEASMNSSKRHFDLHTQMSIERPKEKNLPGITYASPDYRPPPSSDIPLWLQPLHSTEEESEDDVLLTPSVNQRNQDNNEYWGMIIDEPL